MNALLTIIAFTLLGAANIVGIVSFVKDGGIRELIRLAREDDD